MKTQTGFTLIELVVTLVIIGLLAAVAGPKFVDLQSTAKTNVTANIRGAFNSAMAVAFASHRLANASSGFIVDCTTLTAALDGGLPANTTCTGTSITYPDSTPGTITPETATSRAIAS